MSKIQKIQSKVRFKAGQVFSRVTLLPLAVIASVVATTSMTAIAPALASPPETPTASTALGETLLTFQTRQYALRIIRQRGFLRLNLYNRKTTQVEVRDMPMRQIVTDTGIIYTNLQGETSYTVTVAPDGSAYDLKIQQGDRTTYSEHVQSDRGQGGPLQSEQASSTAELTRKNQPDAYLGQPELNQSEPNQPARQPQQQASALQTVLDSETIAQFQTPKYAVRIYSRNDEVRMNLYNRRTDKVELKAVAVKATRSSSSMTYTYPSGNFVYSATIMPIGGYRLVVTQGDRTIYNEQGY